eukprot:7868912-Pyramimonas_sp.AAC.1
MQSPKTESLSLFLTRVVVWILKIPDAERPNDLRPLQLPTCMRRLFGASLADLLGPLIKPQL